jgi:hypothetical protein
VLCAQARGKDVFYLRGGKRESGETDWEALHQEIQKEFNIGLIAVSLTEGMVVQEAAQSKKIF